MKSILNKSIVILLAMAAFVSCKTKDMNYSDANVTAVQNLYEPVNNKQVKLLASATASVSFGWEHSLTQDNQPALYDVLFYKKDGTEPVFITSSDNNGSVTNASITHKMLNKIGYMAGIESGQTGTLYWTIAATRGLNKAIAQEKRELVIKRLEGFADIPGDVFIAGDATEKGAGLADAMSFKSTAEGEFEIFTKLTGGKSFYLVDRTTGTPIRYYIDGSLKEDKTGTSKTDVTKTGVYKISIDFTTATAMITEVTGVGFFWCPTNTTTINLAYDKEGVWKGTGDIAFVDHGGWKDERYKLTMTTVTNGTSSVSQWGTVNSTDGRPDASSPGSYWYMKPVSWDQWNDKWKLATEMDGANVTITVYLQANTPYTHKIVKN